MSPIRFPPAKFLVPVYRPHIDRPSRFLMEQRSVCLKDADKTAVFLYSYNRDSETIFRVYEGLGTYLDNKLFITI